MSSMFFVPHNFLYFLFEDGKDCQNLELCFSILLEAAKVLVRPHSEKKEKDTRNIEKVMLISHTPPDEKRILGIIVHI